MKFKVGDKVEVVKLIQETSLEAIGQKGEIIRICPSHKFPYIINIGMDTGFTEEELKLVGSRPEIDFSCITTEVPDRDVPLKFDDNKPMMHLVRPEFIKGLASALTYGATKYDEKRGSEPNYMRGEGFQYSKILDSLERHLNAFKSGENIDPESQQHHLLLAGVNTMFLYMYEISDKGKDDRYILSAKKEK